MNGMRSATSLCQETKKAIYLVTFFYNGNKLAACAATVAILSVVRTRMKAACGVYQSCKSICSNMNKQIYL